MLLFVRYDRSVFTDLGTDFTAHALVGVDINRSLPFVTVLGLTGTLSPAYGRAVDLQAHFAASTVVSGDGVDRVLELLQRLGPAKEHAGGVYCDNNRSIVP